MLSRSSIFLKLMGSFYEQIGSTDFNISFDKTYSSILLSRYENIMVRMVSSGKRSSIFNTVRSGYIDPLEIDVPMKKIIVRDFKNNIVTDFNFISMSFFNADVAYVVKDGVVEGSTLLELSEQNAMGGIIPIMYGKVGDTQIAISDWATINTSQSVEIIEMLSPAAIELLASVSLYLPDSVSKIELVSNILLGAIYSVTDEVVLLVTNDTVFTDHSEYDITGINTGKAIVVKGDILSPVSLITKLVYVTKNSPDIVDVQDIVNFMTGSGISISNAEYLMSISKAIIKRKMLLNVDSEVMQSTTIDILSILSHMLGTIHIPVQLGSTVENVDSIELNGNELIIVDYELIVNATIIERWILDVMLSPMSISIKLEEENIVANRETSTGQEVMNLSLGVLSVEERFTVNEKSIDLILEDYPVYINDVYLPEGELVSTNIAEITEDKTLLLVDSSTGDVFHTDDGVASTTINKLTVNTSDVFDSIEGRIFSGSIHKMANIIVSDIFATSVIKLGIIDIQDSLLSFSELNSIDVISSSSFDEVISKRLEVIAASDEINAEMSKNSTVIMLDSQTSNGSYAVAERLEVNDAYTHGQAIIESIIGTDTSSVELDETIDI